MRSTKRRRSDALARHNLLCFRKYHEPKETAMPTKQERRRRCTLARAALAAWRGEQDYDLRDEADIRDLITDLLLLADYYGKDALEENRIAVNSFNHEREIQS